MNQKLLNQTRVHFELEMPKHLHRPHMNGVTFVMNGKTYRILEGIFMCVNHEVVDGVKFELVAPPTEPTIVYRMPEKEFFLKTKGLF
jgi:hypothetical protein